MQEIILIMEIIGTIAFSVSGALVAVGCNLDLFGVIFLGTVTATGGGLLRDILMGNLPPRIFANIGILVLAIITALIVFIIAYLNAKRFKLLCEKIEPINNIFDAIGLAVFSVMGTQAAISAGFFDKTCFSILMGMLTGVGGGLLRDVMVSKSPYILTKHIYAVASLLGSTTYYLLELYIDSLFLNSIISMVLVILIRMLSTKYKWSLPKIKL